MNRSQLIAGANAVMAIRPDWNQPGIIAQMQQLDQTWTGTDAGLIAHCLNVAGQPHARTPAAFNAPLPAAPTPEPSSRAPRDQCYICGLSRAQCGRVRNFEVRHGIPDPHEYETKEQADANRSPLQLDLKQRTITGVAAARSKAAYKPDDLPEPRRIQEPAPAG